MRRIDLRSDTVTRPTPAMREAIARAEVGDDVYGEDPSVNRLEADAARRLGKEAALFVPSGTMANQLAIRGQTRHGDVVLVGEGAHVLRYESGAAAALSGVQLQTLGAGGFFSGDEVRAVLAPADVHVGPVSLVALENTHNLAGGRVLSLEQQKDVAEACRAAGLRLHLDGARIFNAAVALGVAPARLAAPFDSVAFCLSKGLGAPVGSLLCGTAELIARARRFRKMFGGGMRQAGILAAAGLHALEHHVERLAEDHRNARRLAEGLSDLGFELDPPQTNIVRFRMPGGAAGARAFARALAARGVSVGASGSRALRAVTHLEVGSDDVELALERAGEALSELLRGAPAGDARAGTA